MKPVSFPAAASVEASVALNPNSFPSKENLIPPNSSDNLVASVLNQFPAFAILLGLPPAFLIFVLYLVSSVPNFLLAVL